MGDFWVIPSVTSIMEGSVPVFVLIENQEQMENPGFVDSIFVKTCDERVTGQNIRKNSDSWFRY